LALTRKRKEELLDQYVDLLNNSSAIFFAEYKGLSVKEVEALRDEIVKVNGVFHITKNTLLRKALEDAGRPVPDDLLVGQIATGFALQEIPSVAKALTDYAKTVDKLTVRGGMIDRKALSPAEVTALADLPTLDQLRGQIIGLISAPAQNIVSTVANGVRQLINVLDAYAKKDDDAAADVAADAA
jgi:large subunit ribosomal protein L10